MLHWTRDSLFCESPLLSQFCGELASQGIVVAALEHRDGSGISSMVRVPPMAPAMNDGSKEGKDSSPKMSKLGRSQKPRRLQVKYFPFEKVGLRSFAEDPSEREMGLRQAQLAMRGAELRECLHVLREIASGKGDEVARRSTRGLTSKLAQVKPPRKLAKTKLFDQEANALKQWEGKLDVDFPALCGHSFGGATVIEMQRRPASETSKEDRSKDDENQDRHGHDSKVRGENEARSPFPYALILDPWVEPILWQGGGNNPSSKEGPDARPIEGPAYILNSETFTVWREHFTKLKRIMRDSIQAQDKKGEEETRGWLMTLAGCQHLDFSDLPLVCDVYSPR